MVSLISAVLYEATWLNVANEECLSDRAMNARARMLSLVGISSFTQRPLKHLHARCPMTGQITTAGQDCCADSRLEPKSLRDAKNTIYTAIIALDYDADARTLTFKNLHRSKMLEIRANTGGHRH